jgi:prepilin-type N-terminal cleavage/methylation domain-containing protein
MRLRKNQFPVRKLQQGFSLLEVVISIAVLTIGAIGLLSVFGVAVKANQMSQEGMLARQLASEAMESIYTARNTAEITWDQIQNVSNGGIFVNGFVSPKCAGPDGILDTADDTSCLTASGAVCPNGGVECLTEPGPDGIMGTADDIILSLNNYQRNIVILPLYDATGNLIPTLRQIQITVTYTTATSQAPRTYTLNEYISEYH